MIEVCARRGIGQNMMVRLMGCALTVALWAFGATAFAQDADMGKQAFVACAPCPIVIPLRPAG